MGGTFRIDFVCLTVNVSLSLSLSLSLSSFHVSNVKYKIDRDLQLSSFPPLLLALMSSTYAPLYKLPVCAGLSVSFLQSVAIRGCLVSQDRGSHNNLFFIFIHPKKFGGNIPGISLASA